MERKCCLGGNQIGVDCRNWCLLGRVFVGMYGIRDRNLGRTHVRTAEHEVQASLQGDGPLEDMDNFTKGK